MSLKQEQKLDHLFDHIHTVSEITCDHCGDIETHHEDGWESAEYFFKKGWTVSNEDEIMCPECNN
jgi:hypothetical protein